MENKKTIYFLCTGNSCRSQMAEAWGKKYLGDKWNVLSAGIEAHGVNPNAIKAMNEVDIDITDQTSDTIDRDILDNADLVVTLCGLANEKTLRPDPRSGLRNSHLFKYLAPLRGLGRFLGSLGHRPSGKAWLRAL